LFSLAFVAGRLLFVAGKISENCRLMAGTGGFPPARRLDELLEMQSLWQSLKILPLSCA
jgi:hypothetical protein